MINLTQRVRAYNELSQAKSSSFDQVTNILTLSKTSHKPTDAEVADKVQYNITNDRIQAIQKDITEFTTTMSTIVTTVIAGKPLTVDQDTRYRIKREAAMADNLAFFEEEAALIGKDSLELLNEVKALSVSWTTAYNTVMTKIDAVRVKLGSLLTGNKLDKVEFMVTHLRQHQDIQLTTSLVEYFANLEELYTTHLEQQEPSAEELVSSTEEPDIIVIYKEG